MPACLPLSPWNVGSQLAIFLGGKIRRSKKNKAVPRHVNQRKLAIFVRPGIHVSLVSWFCQKIRPTKKTTKTKRHNLASGKQLHPLEFKITIWRLLFCRSSFCKKSIFSRWRVGRGLGNKRQLFAQIESFFSGRLSAKNDRFERPDQTILR